MTRLGLLIVLLAVVIAAAIVVQLRVAPDIALSSMASESTSKKLSRADQEKLEGLKEKFAQERDAYLKMRNTGAPADQQEAQNAKARAAAEAVMALGGSEAIKSVGKSKYATKVYGPEDKAGKAAPTCSGEEGGSCSGEEGACSVDLGDKAPGKAEAKDAKPAPAAKEAASAKP
jgi:hypothetical protein